MERNAAHRVQEGSVTKAGLSNHKKFPPLTIIIIVIITTYGLFFLFEVTTELEVRSTILAHAKYEYGSIATRFAAIVSSIQPDKAGTLEYTKAYENLMDSDGRYATMEKQLDPKLQSTEPFEIRPATAIVDSSGTLTWTSDTFSDNNLSEVFESHRIGSFLQKDTSEEPLTNSDAAETISSIEKFADQEGRTREYLIVTSIPHFSNEALKDGSMPLAGDGSGDRIFHLVMLVPLSSIFDHADSILLQQRVQTFSLVAGISVITIVMAYFINKSNKLGGDALDKAKALEESNDIINHQQQQLTLSNLGLQKANEELKRLDKAKDQFIAIASHELKGPIQPILFYAEFGKSGKVDKDKAFESIATNARRLKKLTSDLLDVTKIDSDRLSYNFVPFKLSDLIYEVIEAMRPSLPQGVNLEAEFEDDNALDVNIEGDRMRLFQALSNLVNNAIKFTEQGFVGVIVKTPDFEKGQITIIVRDSGPGIAPELLSNLFGKFVTSSSEENNRQGTGLGLYIAKSIVQAHGGEIQASNNNNEPGSGQSGAQFTILLPILKTQPKIPRSLQSNVS